MGYSYDGINWTASTSGNSILNPNSGICFAVAWNGTLWVAVYYYNDTTIGVMYSYNGIDWILTSYSVVVGLINNLKVGWNGQIWVISNRTNGALYDGKSLHYSLDGINWLLASTTGNYGSLTWNGSLWIAGSLGGAIASSSDGINWTEGTVNIIKVGTSFALASRRVLPYVGTTPVSKVSGSYTSNVVSTSTYSIDYAVSSNVILGLSTATTTLSFINTPTNTVYTTNVWLYQLNGGNVVTWPGSVSWGGASPSTAPTLGTTIDTADYLQLTTFNGGSKWFGYRFGSNF